MAITVSSLGGGDTATLSLRITGVDAYQQAAQAMNQVAAAGDRAQQGANNAARGLALSERASKQLVASMGPLTANLINLPPQLGNVARAVAMLGVGAPAMVGAMAGIAALGLAVRGGALAYDKLTASAREAERAINDLVKKQAEAYRSMRSQSIEGMLEDRIKLAKELQDRVKDDRSTTFWWGSDRSMFGIGMGGAADKARDESLDALRQQNRLIADYIEKTQTIEGVSTRTVEAIRKEAQAYSDANAQLAVLNAQKDLYLRTGQFEITTPISGRAVGFEGSRMPYGYSRSGSDISFQSLQGGIKYPTNLRPLGLPPGYINDVGMWERYQASGGTNWNKWGGVAQVAGGVVLGTGLAGNGYVAAGLSGGLSVAAQGAMLGSVVPGVGTAVGAVVGAVGGLVSGLLGHSKRVREEEERLKEAQRGFNLSLDARLAAARGEDERAEQIERLARNEKELADARKAGMSEASIKVLQMVQAEEKLAAAREKAKQAAEEAAEAERRRTEAAKDLIVRGLSATGNDYWASRASLLISQGRERYDAEKDKMGPEFLAFMDFVHGIELKNLELNESVRLQTQTIQNNANATLSVLDQQLQTAQATAQIAQDQLRNQEQTVNALRNVVDSLTGYSNELKVGSLTTLSPIQQLTSARTQFEAMYALAQGGDLSAAQSIRGAGNTLLSLSRGYNASGAGFVSDFNRVQSAVDALLNKYGAQLPVEERILAELQNQTAQTNTLIQQLGTQIETVRTEAQRQIDAVNAQAAADRADWTAALLKWADANDWLHDIFESLDLLPGKLNEIPGDRPILNDHGAGFAGETTVTDAIRVAAETNAFYTQQGFVNTVDRLERVEGAIYVLRDDLRLVLERNGP